MPSRKTWSPASSFCAGAFLRSSKESHSSGKRRVSWIAITAREKEFMDDFTRRIARDQFALGHMQVGAVALPEIFPVLEGQMVPIEDIPKMVHEGKLESARGRGARTQVRTIPPGIYRSLSKDPDSFARTGQ